MVIRIIEDVNALDKLRKSTEFLERSGIEDAVRNAELIISHCLGIDRVTLYKDNPIIAEDLISKADEFLKRRAKREPIEYILGYTEFYGLRIKVGPGVLIPRPETELLAEEAIKLFTVHRSPFTVLDLCTGSGCIALALAKQFPEARVYGADTSEAAIRYAKENVELNNINNVTFLRGNLFEPFKNLGFNLIISNPPYIGKDDIKYLQPEIKDWEPIEALDGGIDGLDYYRMIIPEAKKYLKEGGCLMLELGVGQADSIKKIAVDTGFIDISLIKDYAGIERVFIGIKGDLLEY